MSSEGGGSHVEHKGFSVCVEMEVIKRQTDL